MSNKIEYTVIRKNIKNVYICVKDGQVIVKAPLKYSKTKIEDLLEQKKDWIEKKLNTHKEDRSIDIKNKNYIYILGNKVYIELKYYNKKLVEVKLNENKCEIYLPQNTKLNDDLYRKIEIKIENELLELSKKYIYFAMKKYMDLTLLKPQKIIIRRFKSIWGNCSSNGVIKINQKIIHYAVEQIEYVCLHELTHLKYMNHQREFWRFIEKYMPNYKEISKVLKQ